MAGRLFARGTKKTKRLRELIVNRHSCLHNSSRENEDEPLRQPPPTPWAPLRRKIRENSRLGLDLQNAIRYWRANNGSLSATYFLLRASSRSLCSSRYTLSPATVYDLVISVYIIPGRLFKSFPDTKIIFWILFFFFCVFFSDSGKMTRWSTAGIGFRSNIEQTAFDKICIKICDASMYVYVCVYRFINCFHKYKKK